MSDAAFPGLARRIGGGVGLAVVLLFVASYWPPSFLASGRPYTAVAIVLVALATGGFFAMLLFAPAALQRRLRGWTSLDLRDGAHVAAAVVMVLTLGYVLGFGALVNGTYALEEVYGPPPSFEPPPAPAAGAPLAPNATAALVNGTIRLDWTPDANGTSADGWRVYRGLAEGRETFVASVNATSWTDANVSQGRAYLYRVAGDSRAGVGAASESVAVLVPVDEGLLYAGILENMIVLTLPALFYVAMVHGLGPRAALHALGIRGQGWIRGVLLGVGAAILFLVVLQLAALAAQRFVEIPDNDRAIAIGLGMSVTGALVVAVGSSVSEEVFFRGFLQPRIGFLGQAVVFAVAHVNYVNVLEVVVVFALAFVFGALYRWTGSLWAPIAAHFAFNLINLLGIVCANDPAACGA